jgi:hypothetical protein
MVVAGLRRDRNRFNEITFVFVLLRNTPIDRIFISTPKGLPMSPFKMPRRPSKKQKAIKSRPAKRSDAKLTRWETIDDIPLDEEDACECGTRLMALQAV